jgi:peroxiredoxin
LRRALAATAVLILATCAACSSQADRPAEARKPAYPFSLKDSNGQAVQLSDYRGKVVLLNFWATWCGPCKVEIPWFVEFERQYRDRGFAVLGISMDEEGWDVVKPFLAGMNVNYRVLMGDEDVARAYGGVESLPTSFIIDREGRIAATHVGLVSKSAYVKDLEALL